MKNDQNFPPYKTELVSNLVPYAMNSRTHSDAQIDQIAASIKEFGFTNPVLIDGENGIIAGHGRAMAAMKLGIKSVPVIELSHLSDVQKKAYIIADNKLALNAGWNNEILAIEFEALENSDFDLELTGFDSDEISELFDDDSGDVIDENELSFEDGLEPKCNNGDIYMLGRHILMCGDSSNIDDVEKLLNGVKPELLIYDPPYDVDESWTWQYPASKCLVFSDYKHVKEAISVASSWEYCYQFVWDCCTSWYTPNRPLARHKTAFFCSDDPSWGFDSAIYQDGKERKAKTVSNTRGDCEYTPLSDGFVHLQTVYQEPNTKQDSAHAHAKPVKWLNSMLRGSKCAVALDLFGGSGATIIAAPDNMTVYCMELDEGTCDKIIARWESYSGCPVDKLAIP